MRRAREIDARTPAHRDRYVDFLRAASILMVVIGHWLAIALFVEDGRVDGVSALAVLPWARVATWAFQVMPVFFFVGGFANAASWESHRRTRGGGWASWAVDRADRLLLPTALYLAVGMAGVALARAGGVDPGLVEQAGWVVNIALWFLAVYVVVAAAAPLMLAAHARWGAWAFVALAAAVVTVDVLRLAAGVPVIGAANFAFGWLAFQQLGFLWRDGVLTRRALLPPVAALGGLVALIALTTLGPYPVSMVGVPGAEIDNAAPPTVALLALGIAQMGLALTLRPAFDGLLERPVPWMLVVAINASILTIYLWHLVPVVAAAALMTVAPAAIPQPPVDSPAWIALRPVWVAALAVLLVPVVLAARPAERAAAARERMAGRWGRVAGVAVALGLGLASAGLVLFTLGGFHGEGPLGLPLAAAAFLPAVLLLQGAPRLARGPGGDA